MRRMKQGCTVQTYEAYLVVAMVLQNAGTITKCTSRPKLSKSHNNIKRSKAIWEWLKRREILGPKSLPIAGKQFVWSCYGPYRFAEWVGWQDWSVGGSSWFQLWVVRTETFRKLMNLLLLLLKKRHEQQFTYLFNGVSLLPQQWIYRFVWVWRVTNTTSNGLQEKIWTRAWIKEGTVLRWN